jgi:methylthioribose-1-phosphate isomerase
LLMMQGRVDAVIVGCDRVSANGDVVNKIGTYLKALAAAAHSIPFYVACPLSTIDLASPNGASVPIEVREPQEVSIVQGMNEQGELVRVRLTPSATACANPAFDVTPAALVSYLVTEQGACRANEAAILKLMPQQVPT